MSVDILSHTPTDSMSMHVLLKHPDFHTVSHRCAFFLLLELTLIALLYPFIALFSLLSFFFFCLHAVFWDFSVTLCVSLTNSLLCHLSVSPLLHILALSFSGRDVWGEAGLFAPHGVIQWLGHTYCHTACQSMVCLSQQHGLMLRLM